MSGIGSIVIDAFAWRWQHARIRWGRGVIARLPRYRDVFASWHDGLEYSRSILALRRAPEPRAIHLRQLGGSAVRCDRR